MSEKNPTNADGSTEKTTQGGDEYSTEITYQIDTSQTIVKDGSLEDGQDNDQRLARNTDDLEQTQHAKEPPKETMGPGPTQGPDAPPTQNQNSGPSPNQEPGSRETQDPSSPQMHESEEPPSGNLKPESTETQQPSPSQTQNPADKIQLEQNAGQQLTEQGILQEQSQLQTQNPVVNSLEQSSDLQTQNESPQETQEPDQQEPDQQPTESGQKDSDPGHTEETDSQENEIKENNQTDSTPPTKLETTTVETAPKSEGETPSLSVDIDSKHRPQNSEDEANPNIGSLTPPADLTSTDETHMEPDIISQNNSEPMEKNFGIPDIPKPPCEPDSTTSNDILDNQGDGTPKESEKSLEVDYEEREENSGEKKDKPAEPSEQEGEGQTLQTKPDQEQGEDNEHEVFQEQSKPQSHVVLIETSDGPAIEDLLKNCQKYKDELQMAGNLNGAVEQYETLLKKAKETGCQEQKSISPPSELNSVNDKERNQAPLLYAVIADVSERVPSYKRWKEAVSEFIILTTLSQSEPKSSHKKRSNSHSGYQNKTKQPAKLYYNNIEKLLDQDWGPDRAPGPSVYNDYRHLFTCESVLRSTFPEADIFGLVDSTIHGPEDVPPELRHKALFHFLLSFNRKKYGVEPSDAWRDFGRLVLAEKQLELAKKAQGPDLHLNIIVKRLDFYRMQNELKEKTEEVEELSTRLSKFASQQLTEGNPNIADLSDTHRPTRLGEMYSQLFDDEWSEAFEAFKPKTEDEDDDIFPDTLFILQDLLTNIFDFCKNQSKSQKTYLEDSFALAIGLTEPQVLKKEDAARETENTIKCEDTSTPDKSEHKGSSGDTGSSTDTKDKEEQVKECQKETNEKSESSEHLSTPLDKEDDHVEKETPNKLELGKSEEELCTDTNTNNMQETPSHATQTEDGGESSKPSETDEGNSIPPTDKTDNGTDKHVENEKQNETPEEADLSMKNSEGNDVDKNDESSNLDKHKEEKKAGNNENDNGDPEIKNSEQTDQEQQTSKATVEEEPSNQTPNEKNQEVLEEGRTDTDQSDSSQKDQAQEPGREDKQQENKDYRKSIIYPTLDRHARDFRKAAASTSAKTKSKLFITTELPALILDETVRADVRVLTYVRKCVELCWYMCMQDPPMVIVSPKQGQLVDKTLFSFHGRRGKIVEVCVWPALLLHDNGPLVCKGYVLPEERNRNK